jgi:hypothetical protein
MGRAFAASKCHIISKIRPAMSHGRPAAGGGAVKVYKYLFFVMDTAIW